MTKIILFKKEISENPNAPAYNVVMPVSDGVSEKLVTIGSAWNQVNEKTGTKSKSISLKKETYTKEDGTVYPSAKVFFKGVEFTNLSLYSNKADNSKYTLMVSRKNEITGVWENEFASKGAGVVGEGDKARVEIELNEFVEVKLDYTSNVQAAPENDSVQNAKNDYDNFNGVDTKYPTDNINPEDIPF